MALALLLATLPLVQDAPPAREVVSLSSRGIEALLVDSKDQGLRRALALLEPHLGELGRELGTLLEVPPAALILVATYGEDGVPGGVGADRDLSNEMIRKGDF